MTKKELIRLKERLEHNVSYYQGKLDETQRIRQRLRITKLQLAGVQQKLSKYCKTKQPELEDIL